MIIHTTIYILHLSNVLKLCWYYSMDRSLSQSLTDPDEFLSQHVHGIVMVNALLVLLEMVLYRYYILISLSNFLVKYIKLEI